MVFNATFNNISATSINLVDLISSKQNKNTCASFDVIEKKGR
jgi:hypothetical protein